MNTKKPTTATNIKKKQTWSDLSPEEKRQGIIGTAILFVIIFGVIWVVNLGNGKSTDQSNSANVSANLPVDEQLKQIVASAAVDGDGFADAIREVRVIPEADGSNTVNVKFYQEKNIEKRFLDQTMGVIYYALYSSGKDVGAVTVMATTDLVDSYGNGTEGIVYQTTISKADADKVNTSQDEAVLEMSVYPGLWVVQKQHSGVK